MFSGTTSAIGSAIMVASLSVSPFFQLQKETLKSTRTSQINQNCQETYYMSPLSDVFPICLHLHGHGVARSK